MTSDALSPRTWLARHPLQAGECLYAVFGSASDAAPLQAYYREDSPPPPLPLWNGTPYADWQPVMPYLAKLSPSSVFLDWAASEKSRDWGWLAVSTWSTDAILEHLRSLTQVRMPDGSEVFFRFWDVVTCYRYSPTSARKRTKYCRCSVPLPDQWQSTRNRPGPSPCRPSLPLVGGSAGTGRHAACRRPDYRYRQPAAVAAREPRRSVLRLSRAKPAIARQTPHRESRRHG